jgi:hypothetical protein
LYVYLHIDANVTYCANECSFSVVVPLVVWVLSDCTVACKIRNLS